LQAFLVVGGGMWVDFEKFDQNFNVKPREFARFLLVIARSEATKQSSRS